MEGVNEILRTSSEISGPDQDQIMQKASKMTAAMMQALTKRVKLKTQTSNHPREPYSEAIREFAVSLHNISPAAYRYIRESLDLVLPDERTLQRWISKVDCSPGLHEQEKDIFDFNLIKKFNSEPKD